MAKNAWIKLALLSEGLTPTPEFTKWFASTSGFVRRRNFYNNPNWSEDGGPEIPQEIRLAGDESVVVAVNDYGRSGWRLHWDENLGPQVVSDDLPEGYSVDLVNDLSSLQTDSDVANISNLYGGSALSFFSPRACYFFSEGTQCRFCSLAGTARESSAFAGRLTPKEVHDAVAKVVETDRSMLSQIMIVGGNERDLNRGFSNQTALVKAASEALAEAGLVDDISVHLIAMPPNDLTLIDHLAEVPNLHAGFNLEVWDPDRFTQIAPGKTKDYGQDAILTALDHLREVIGPYRAHSILIAGLELAEVTLTGAEKLASEGISPIINVYHSDKDSLLGLSVRPTYQQLVEVASGLQELHRSFAIQPYWKGCGRNALDYEASHGLFSDVPLMLNQH